MEAKEEIAHDAQFLLLSASVRRLRKPGNTRPEHRQAVYIHEEDVVRRSRGNATRQPGSKRFGGEWDKNAMEITTSETTPLLDDTRTEILRAAHEQTQSAEYMTSRCVSLRNATDEAFKKTAPPPKSFWRQCCGCCYRSDEDR